MSSGLRCTSGCSRSAEDILDYGKGKLADFKLPSEIRVVAEPFPRNTSDKINKAALRAMLMN